MSQNILQILLLLSYLDIALISITIAVYSISVSYLGRETSRSISRKKKRENELGETLEKLKKRLGEKQIDAIEKEMKFVQSEIVSFRRRQKSLQQNLSWLSTKGAVLIPNTLFTISLFLSAVGILEIWYPEPIVILATAFVAFGALCLGKSLRAAERAALEIPRPEYEILFASSELATKRCKAKTVTPIHPLVHNIGDERSENLLVVIYIPKGINAVSAGGSWQRASMISKAKPLGEFVELYSQTIDFMNVDHFRALVGLRIVAKETGTYRFIVQIKEKTGKSAHKLTLEVV